MKGLGNRPIKTSVITYDLRLIYNLNILFKTNLSINADQNWLGWQKPSSDDKNFIRSIQIINNS